MFLTPLNSFWKQVWIQVAFQFTPGKKDLSSLCCMSSRKTSFCDFISMRFWNNAGFFWLCYTDFAFLDSDQYCSMWHMRKYLLLNKWVMKGRRVDVSAKVFNLKKSRGKQTKDMKNFKYGIPDLSSPYTQSKAGEPRGFQREFSSTDLESPWLLWKHSICPASRREVSSSSLTASATSQVFTCFDFFFINLLSCWQELNKLYVSYFSHGWWLWEGHVLEASHAKNKHQRQFQQGGTLIHLCIRLFAIICEKIIYSVRASILSCKQ